MRKFILDTNIVIRYLINDNPIQYQKAKNIFMDIEDEKCVGCISILVVDEIIWVMEQYYGFKRSEYIPKLRHIFALNNVKIIETKKDTILRIFQRMEKTHIDFTDYYLETLATQTPILSFDKDFEKMK